MAQPKHKLFIGEFQIAVWEEEKTNKSGYTFTDRSFSLQRGYKDANGKWINETIYLRANQLPKLEMLINNAYRYHVMNSVKSAEGDKAKDVEAYL